MRYEELGRSGRFYGGSRYRWVDPNRENRTKEAYPYSYSDHYLWGAATKDSDAVYSDRLGQWDREAFNRGWEAGGKKRFNQMNEGEVSAFLTAYWNKPTEAVALAEGCNVATGFPYWIIWYRHPKTNSR